LRAVKAEEGMVIRMSLSSLGEGPDDAWGRDGRRVHLIVSDTGPGFREPGRMFDPFQTLQDSGDSVGMGLSLCYSIVQEHGGEISAFNLHPHGAAVAVELPVMRVAGKKSAGLEGAARRVAV
jgi:signal transduction histidine kinase